MATETATAPRQFKIPLGFYPPGVFAGSIKKLTQDGAPATDIETDVRELQSLMHWQCPCSPEIKRALTLFTRRQVHRLGDIARNEPYTALLAAVERLFATARMKCPACGRTASPKYRR